MAKYLDESGVKTLWSKIKSKLSNKADITGTVAKAHGVTDYGNRNGTISIGYSGPGLIATEHFAAYDTSGSKIKDISVANTKKVLGINGKMDNGVLKGFRYNEINVSYERDAVENNNPNMYFNYNNPNNRIDKYHFCKGSPVNALADIRCGSIDATTVVANNEIYVANSIYVNSGSEKVATEKQVSSKLGKTETAAKSKTVYGDYTGNGGNINPSQIGTYNVQFNMMRLFEGAKDPGAYMDCILMNCYTWADVPYATAIGVTKTHGNPRLFIANGGNDVNWAEAKEMASLDHLSVKADTTYVTTELSKKQNNLTQNQINAVNSGITQAKVQKYDGYETTINSKANTTDVNSKLAGKLDKTANAVSSSCVIDCAYDQKINISFQNEINDTTWFAAWQMKNGVPTIETMHVDKVKNALGIGEFGPLQAYPVGSIYMSVSSTSPASLFGGSWQRLEDRFLLGAGAKHPTLSYADGEERVTLAVSQLPSHDHTGLFWGSNFFTYDGSTGTNYQGGWRLPSGTWMGSAANIHNFNVGSTGSGLSHNNMPPYLVVNMWKRVS